MKYVTATATGVFMFVATFLLAGLLLGAAAPKLSEIQLTVGSVTTNLLSLISLLLAALAATSTFRATFRAKTGRLYRKRKS